MDQNIRWRQRFENFEKAFGQLTEFIEKGELNKFEKQGLIKCFEYSFELAWKTVKDYLHKEGLDAMTPRSVIQQAFHANVISEGHRWIEALEGRNLLVHTYDESLAEGVILSIYSKFYPFLRNFYDSFKLR